MINPNQLSRYKNILIAIARTIYLFGSRDHDNNQGGADKALWMNGYYFAKNKALN
ncbi:MAG: hypothetical protein NT124_01770 [Candidatus Dependentiae bacterium]|nr:hypothetical protein [Candidatus Dependentiae bacterium]